MLKKDDAPAVEAPAEEAVEEVVTEVKEEGGEE